MKPAPSSLSINSIFDERQASAILQAQASVNMTNVQVILDSNRNEDTALILPEPPMNNIMKLDLDQVEDLYTISGETKIEIETTPEITSETKTNTKTEKDREEEKVNDSTSSKQGRYMDFRFVDSGVAYGEIVKTSMTVEKRIQLDQRPTCQSVEWVPTPCIRDGINFVGWYNIRWRDSDTIELLVPGLRSYDPAGIKYDPHASVRIGGACAALMTSTFVFMLKAMMEGALLEDIVALQMDEINPLVLRYHGRIPLAMWMLHQIQAAFGTLPKSPLSYAIFLRRSIRVDTGSVTGRYLEERVQFDSKTGTYVDVKGDGSCQHMIEFLLSLEAGAPAPPIDYYTKIIADLAKRMQESKENASSRVTIGQRRRIRPAKEETKKERAKEIEETAEKAAIIADPLLEQYLTNKYQFELAVERLMVSVLSSRGELTQSKLSIVDMLLNKWARTFDLKSILSRGYTQRVLENTAKYGAVRCERGIDIILRPSTTSILSPLILSAKLNSESLLNMLLKSRKDASGLVVYVASPNQRDETGWTALMHACRWGRHKPVRHILRHRQGWRPRRIGRLEDVTHLQNVLPLPVDPNIQDLNGLSALMIACMYGHRQAVEELLGDQEALEDMRMPNANNDRGPRVDLELKTRPRACMLSQNVVGESTALHIVASLPVEFPQLFELLLRAKALTSQRDVNGSTPLHCATKNAHVMLIQQLIDFDADVNTTNAAGLSPLHVACHRALSARSVKLLLAAGADIHQKCLFSRTPIHYAYLASGELQQLMTSTLAMGVIKRFWRLSVSILDRKSRSSSGPGRVVVYYYSSHGQSGTAVKYLRRAGATKIHFVDLDAVPERLKDKAMVNMKEQQVEKKRKEEIEAKNENQNENAKVGKETGLRDDNDDVIDGPTIFFNNQCLGTTSDIQILARKKSLRNLLRHYCKKRSPHIDAPQPPYQKIYACPNIVGQILIFARTDCNFCKRCKLLFDSLGVQYEIVDVQEYPGKLKDMHGMTVPEVWFNDKLIGGYQECIELNESGELDTLIEECLKTEVPPAAPKPTYRDSKKITMPSPSSVNGSLGQKRTVLRESNHEYVRVQMNTTSEIINECIQAGADLDSKEDYHGFVAFDVEESDDWFEQVEEQLIASSSLPSGIQDEIWKDKRTQIAVERKWREHTRQHAVIQMIVWVLFIGVLLIVSINHCALDSSTSYVVRTAIRARINGKPYDFSEQPNKRYLDTDTRQDVYNYLGEDGCVGNLYDKENFYVRNANGIAHKHPVHVDSMGENPFTVRHLRLLGNPRLRQLRAVCNSELCPVGRPWNIVGKSDDTCCAPPFKADSTYGEDRSPFIGKKSETTYTWSAANQVPNAYRFNDWFRHPTLSGDGYSVLIPNNRSKALALVQQLKDDEWIDLCTRAIFLEFSVVNDYEAVVGMFRATIETPSAGFVIPSEEITVSRHRNSTWDTIWDVVLVLLFILLWYGECEDMFCRGWYMEKNMVGKTEEKREDGLGLMQFTPKNIKYPSYLFQYRHSGSYGSGYYHAADLSRSSTTTSTTTLPPLPPLPPQPPLRPPMETSKTQRIIEMTEASIIQRTAFNMKNMKNMRGRRKSMDRFAYIQQHKTREYSIQSTKQSVDPIPHFSYWNFTTCQVAISSWRIPKYLWMLFTRMEDMLQILLVIACIFVTVCRFTVNVHENELKQQVETAASTSSEWFASSVFHLQASSFHLRCSLAFALLLSFFNMIYKMNFNRQVALFTIIIEAMVLKLSAFLKIFLVAAVAFATFAWVLFGQGVLVYSTFFGALMQMIGGGTIQGFAHWDETQIQGQFSSAVFHLLFVAFFVVLLLNLLIAVMTEGYEEMRERAAESWAFSQYQQYQEMAMYGSPRKSIVSLCCLSRRHRILRSIRAANQQRKAIKLHPGEKISAAEFKIDMQLTEEYKHDQNTSPSSKIALVMLKWYDNVRHDPNVRHHHAQKQKREQKRLNQMASLAYQPEETKN